jgi:hypothetical protein
MFGVVFGLSERDIDFEDKLWKVWLGVVSSNDFSKEAIIRAEDHEGKSLGLILVNPRLKQFHSSLRGQCKKGP